MRYVAEALLRLTGQAAQFESVNPRLFLSIPVVGIATAHVDD